MIVYPLRCADGHDFEGWFASAEACDQQAKAGQLSCPTCASAQVHKLPSAPYVKGAAAAKAPSNDAQPRRNALRALREYILANTENVGRRFAETARRIHYGEERERAIRGEATVEEALELREEGIAAYAVSPEVIPSGEVH